MVILRSGKSLEKPTENLCQILFQFDYNPNQTQRSVKKLKNKKNCQTFKSST